MVESEVVEWGLGRRGGRGGAVYADGIFHERSANTKGSALALQLLGTNRYVNASDDSSTQNAKPPIHDPLAEAMRDLELDPSSLQRFCARSYARVPVPDSQEIAI